MSDSTAEYQRIESEKNSWRKGTSKLKPIHIVIIGILAFLIYWAVKNKWFDKNTSMVAIGIFVIGLIIFFSRPSEQYRLLEAYEVMNILEYKLNQRKNQGDIWLLNAVIKIGPACHLHTASSVLESTPNPTKYEVGFKLRKNSRDEDWTAEMNPYTGQITGFNDRRATGYTGMEKQDIKFIPPPAYLDRYMKGGTSTQTAPQ